MDSKRDEEEAPLTATPRVYSSGELGQATYNYYAGYSKSAAQLKNDAIQAAHMEAAQLKSDAAQAAHMEARRAHYDALFIQYELKLATMTAAVMEEPWRKVKFRFGKRAEFVEAWPVLQALADKHGFLFSHDPERYMWGGYFSETIEFMLGCVCYPPLVARLFRSKHAPHDPEDWRPDA
jgi:hypothetical protein